MDLSNNSFCAFSSESLPPSTLIDRSEESDEDALDRTNLEEPLDEKIINDRGLMTPFIKFRLQYILAYIGIMLADGLQGMREESCIRFITRFSISGASLIKSLSLSLSPLQKGTHLYVLYEGYGFSVASLYSLGFVSGAFTSPFIGAFVDKFGRKNAAILYCVLEIIINYMEQYPILVGLVLSRVIGGITTNLLCSCFETWLITEHRQRGFAEDKLEVILRDSGIVSNSAAILSGFMAHILASTLGPVGPFQGAVASTFGALILVACLWSENYGDSGTQSTTIYGHVCKSRKVARSRNGSFYFFTYSFPLKKISFGI